MKSTLAFDFGMDTFNYEWQACLKLRIHYYKAQIELRHECTSRQVTNWLSVVARFYNGQDHCLVHKPSSSVNSNGLEYLAALTLDRMGIEI